jgi:hypothetical protein
VHTCTRCIANKKTTRFGDGRLGIQNIFKAHMMNLIHKIPIKKRGCHTDRHPFHSMVTKNATMRIASHRLDKCNIYRVTKRFQRRCDASQTCTSSCASNESQMFDIGKIGTQLSGNLWASFIKVRLQTTSIVELIGEKVLFTDYYRLFFRSPLFHQG